MCGKKMSFRRVSITKEFCLNDDEGGVSLIPQKERLTIEFKLFFLNGDLFCFLFCVDDNLARRSHSLPRLSRGPEGVKKEIELFGNSSKKRLV
jgi:hypothetical protein